MNSSADKNFRFRGTDISKIFHGFFPTTNCSTGKLPQDDIQHQRHCRTADQYTGPKLHGHDLKPTRSARNPMVDELHHRA
jgi:hypothetical protein